MLICFDLLLNSSIITSPQASTDSRESSLLISERSLSYRLSCSALLSLLLTIEDL